MLEKQRQLLRKKKRREIYKIRRGKEEREIKPEMYNQKENIPVKT